MYATVQTRLPRKAILKSMKLCAKAIVQNVSMRTDKGSVNYIHSFLNQMKRETNEKFR